MTRDQALFLDNHGDDVYGLWEAGWYFNSQDNPLPKDQRPAFLAQLVAMGLLDVFRTFDPVSKGDALPAEVASDVVSNPLNWDAPADGYEGELYYIKESETGSALRQVEFPNL